MIERTWHLRTRTVRALYFIGGSCTLLVVGLGIFILLGMAILPSAANEMPLR